MSIRNAVPTLSLILALAACGGTPCNDAEDKLVECFPDAGSGEEEGDAPACEGDVLCASECVNAASCDEIEAAFAGEQNEYADCNYDCTY